MAGPVQPLLVVKGETKVLRYTVIDNSTGVYALVEGQVVEGARVSVSGASSIEWQAHYPPGSPLPLAISKALGSGIVPCDQDAADTKGSFDVTLDPADTSALVAKLYKYDLVMMLSGRRYVLVRPSDLRLIEPVNAA